MIVGEVKPGQEASVSLTVTGPADHQIKFDAVVDTRFTDYLTIPKRWVNGLGLRFRESMTYELANGELATFDLYEIRILWDGRWRKIVASVADGGPLVGMGLMHGCRLTVDVIDGGRVEIRAL